MDPLSTLFILFLLCSVQGSEIVVKNVAKKTARIGGNVTLLCQLMTSEPNIIQITWQKESGNYTGPVATTSKTYGQKLLGHYFNRASHSTYSTHNTSAITISSVTPEDEGCFKCIFNLFPLGASTGTTCLEVYEANLLEPTLEVKEVTHPDRLENLHSVTCSTTGKPAPKISWIFPKDLHIVTEDYSILNLNETVTVISNFTLRSSSILDMKVNLTCVVHHPILSSERHLSTSIDGTRNQNSSQVSVLSSSIIVSSIIVILIVLILWRIRSVKKRPYKRSWKFMPVVI